MTWVPGSLGLHSLALLSVKYWRVDSSSPSIRFMRRCWLRIIMCRFQNGACFRRLLALRCSLLVFSGEFDLRSAWNLTLTVTTRFGWTGFTASIHWMAPIAAGIFIGFGVLCIFLPCFNYLVDSYLPLWVSILVSKSNSSQTDMPSIMKSSINRCCEHYTSIERCCWIPTFLKADVR